MSSSRTPDEPAAHQQTVQEFVDSRGVVVASDAAAGVLRGVKLLGLTSRNARRYRESALREAITLYEGAKVNVNHPRRDPLAPRDYRDRLGVVRNVRFEPTAGLFGDLHFNPKHALAEQLAWDAEHAPENVGLSHNVIARTRRDGDQVVVEAISRVQSVDLVADPATTNGLFEHTAADVRPGEGDAACAVAESTADPAAVDRERSLRAELASARKRARLAELCLEHGVGADHSAFWSTAFAQQVERAEEAQLVGLFEDRVTLMGSRSSNAEPESRERLSDAGADTAVIDSTAGFVSAISRAS
ncbi:MAG: hypothetical protein AAF805_03370 [Planctomycetota bacterium]